MALSGSGNNDAIKFFTQVGLNLYDKRVLPFFLLHLNHSSWNHSQINLLFVAGFKIPFIQTLLEVKLAVLLWVFQIIVLRWI